ncbi:hypothetical protein [Sporichthya sp.]|uniref:hypothetical protein n=1 Tax=Sporichthya sp. TaxID=65475 RepID=UPI00181573FC|nr:hypothetical protein [Sporichthya sp.]MBA3742018.1 hypothetical protein [Sporichthya sp.]
MKVPVKLTVFAASTAAVFALAFGVGSAFDPIVDSRTVGLAAADDPADGGHSGMDMGSDTGEEPPGGSAVGAPTPGGAPAPAGPEVPGLAVSERGYALRLDDPSPGVGDAVEVAFTIESPDGGPVLNYRPTHEKELHLIVVRRDFTGFQHLHPERDETGTWSVPVNLTEAGVYRVFADFAPASLTETLTLGADVFVPGEFDPAELPAPSTEWSDDGYEVTLSGTPGAGVESEVAFTVTRDGSPVSDLEPYLGAFGHLVSLRSGDLAYLHTHPVDEATAGQRGGPDIRFGTTFPTAGRYRLYLNFAHGGSVRTAEFTVDVPATASVPTADAPSAPTTSSAPSASTEPEAAGGGHSGH